MAAVNAARDGQTALALRLTKHLAPADAAGKNVAFSPVSVHAGLALVAAGAGGATQAQLLSFLGAPTADGLAAFGRHVSERVLADRADSGGPRVLFGGGVWIDESRGGLKKEFQDIAAKSYRSEARTVSFTEEPEEAVEMINSWVKKATNNLIDSMISRSDITSDTDLVLANAVYFKGSWLDPFNFCHTSPGKFHRLDGSHVEPSFMSKLKTMYISCMDGFKVLKLPYGPEGVYEYIEGTSYKIHRGPRATSVKSGNATQFSMFVFLPDKHYGISTMVDLITSAPGYLYSVLPTETKLVSLEVPKLEISFDWNLGKDLRQLGLTLPFSTEAGDLRGMYKNDDGRPTFLTKVAHKAVIKVNEEGTEAAAVMTSLRGGGGPPPDMVKFVADHPFTFMIMEERSGVIVFAGHVLDPTCK
ncbi:hypothetical protein QYE76_048351 [Lolium multiflorum]|uniref:Serpin domain-containing protein n=1 Tax=Lolium multiflorum TaxID=4521 RepID=A0AAD8PYD3_LOLMU|nr:hypothetical protein QYE76_059221 [Lolium multiflorum]KAK1590384.1 hypothetical protein QYE76_048351 [Lolium multiflorum]